MQKNDSTERVKDQKQQPKSKSKEKMKILREKRGEEKNESNEDDAKSLDFSKFALLTYC